MRITSERRYEFPLDPDGFWAEIDRTDRYRVWWPWLRAFDGAGLAAGDEWACVIRPPLPYLVRVAITLREVERPHRVVADISGDLVGSARLDVLARPDGCTAQLSSTLAPQRWLLRAMATVAPGLARSGHHAVLDRGAGQLAERLRAADH